MSIREYLYVDFARLNFYIDQLNLPEKRQKVPKWTAKLGLLPEVTATQEEQLRDRNTHDKIEQLLQGLRERELLAKGRFVGREAFFPDAQLFRLETTTATKVFLPPAEPEDLLSPYYGAADDEPPLPRTSKRALRNMPQLRARHERERQREHAREREIARLEKRLVGFRGISLWVADRDPGEISGQLYLLIGFPRDDTEGFGSWSAYSALAGIFRDLGSELHNTVLHCVAGEDLNRPEGSTVQQAFLNDPLEWLESIGAQCGPDRDIQTLYRVRDAVLYRDLRDGSEAIATVAYPIFVVAHGF